MKEKRIAFACDTPLQVLNAINLKETHFAECKSDIFVYNQFGSAKQLVDNLKEANIFESVYLVERYRQYANGIQKFATLKRIFFPYITLKKYISSSEKPKKYIYDTVVFSFITTFSITVFGIANAKEYLHLEDGLGTYIGDILNDYTSGLFKKIISITKYKNILSPTEVCVYNPEIYAGGIPTKTLESDFSESLKKKIESVFGYKPNNIYKERKLVYLSQPMKDMKGYDEENYKGINEILRKHKTQLVVRIHPREQTSVYEEFQLDTIKNLWELECIHQIEDNNILIAAFSTAQLMPKVLTNKEPYIIMVYNLLEKHCNPDTVKELDEFVDKFKRFYQNSQKIFVPETVEELEEIFLNIIKKEKVNE